MNKWTQKDFDFFVEISEKLINKVPFAFSRWGDGEWATVSLNQTDKQNCDGNKYYLELGQKLRSIVSTKQDYYMGHQNVNGYTLKDEFPQEWVNSDILHELNQMNSMHYVFEIFENLDVVLVGNESLGKLPFVNDHIEIPYNNVWLQYGEVLNKIKSKIENNKRKTFLFAAGMCSEVFIHELWLHNKNNTYMDIGSAFDPYVGRKTRRYHHQLII